MTPIRTALPPIAQDALRLYDDRAFVQFWCDLTAALLAHGQPPAVFREAREAYITGWNPDSGAHEIADLRAKGCAP